VDEQWWPMGDIGRINPDGSLELLDRLVDHAEGTDSFLEVEDAVLDRLPELIELVMLKAVGGHDVVAVACPRDGEAEALDTGRLLEALRETSLGAVPVYVMDFDDLPLTGSYKVRRLLLRSRLIASGAAPTVGADA
jgi:acyl-coenzyme A synthetase/AMP-(fatty) acid ligase